MKIFLNSWIIKYLTVFTFIVAVLFVTYHYLYYTPYTYLNYEYGTNSVLKINKITGEVYKFSSGTGQWTLLNK